MNIPNFVKAQYRKYDKLYYLKEDLRVGFSIDKCWYSAVIEAVDELSEKEFLGFKENEFIQLVTYFDKSFSLEEKKELRLYKYDKVMSNIDKAMESLLVFYNAIFDRFTRKYSETFDRLAHN